VLGVREPAVALVGRDVGIAYALAGLLRALPLLSAAGRPIIPADIAVGAGLDPAARQAAHATPALRAAIAEIAASARRHLRSARIRRDAVPRAALPALLPAVIAERSLTRLRRAANDPFASALARPDPLQSWRLAVAALRRRF
jgi:NADH dehydrogenase [ubiquinone] 1 alpha subcomplex assembly factor 6